MGHVLLLGDCLDTLSRLPAQSVHTCVTSPPYFGLRDYQVDGQLGLEETPDLYIAKMVEVFREVRRVLRDDGTLWLNIGDSYASVGGVCQPHRDSSGGIGKKGTRGTQPFHAAGGGFVRPSSLGKQVKPKDLLGIPWMLAFALRADGWYLRQGIIWAKPNPMPESVRDRCTKSHEYIFLLTKQPTYYFDHEAMKEPATSSHPAGNKSHKYVEAYETSDSEEHRTKAGLLKLANVVWATRNRRSVWTVTTKPFRGAHFATFPPALIEPCILAGTSDGGACAACGTPLERIVEKGPPDLEHQIACGSDSAGNYDGEATKDYATAGAQNASDVKRRILEGMRPKITVGYRKTCTCDTTATTPCTVLDPFGGSGTSSMVAQKHHRNSIMCELNSEYVPLARGRVPGLRVLRIPIAPSVSPNPTH
jgi:DNA modification methylase